MKESHLMPFGDSDKSSPLTITSVTSQRCQMWLSFIRIYRDIYIICVCTVHIMYYSYVPENIQYSNRNIILRMQCQRGQAKVEFVESTDQQRTGTWIDQEFSERLLAESYLSSEEHSLVSLKGRFSWKTMGKWWFNGGLMGFYGIYPLVMTNIAIEHGDL